MDPAKGHAELLEALPDLLAHVPDVTAVLAGPDDVQHPALRECLAERVRALGLDGQVRLLGHQPAAPLIAASDVVCVPTVPRPDGSGREGFGLVTAESLTLGVPVVAYDVGATREVLGGSGALVDVGDRAGLAREVARLLTDPVHRADVTVRGRARAAELTLERTAGQLLDLYEEVTR
jgi:phosphatidylinositol alpha-mannosyltransferase